jgi:hypothetical protein
MRPTLIAAAVMVLALPAAAQTPAPAAAPAHLRGKVVSLEGTTLTIAKPIKSEDIKAGSFIGTTEKPKDDGTGTSMEVHVFPPGVKMGEGHYDWDLTPGSMMTNGTVDTVVTGVSGRDLTVSYKGGSRKVTVPPNVPIVAFGPGDKALVAAGASVFIIGLPKPDGTYVAGSVVTGEGGTVPPM